jgi:hypothetical protein
VRLGGLSAIPPEEARLVEAAPEHHTEEVIGRGRVRTYRVLQENSSLGEVETIKPFHFLEFYNGHRSHPDFECMLKVFKEDLNVCSSIHIVTNICPTRPGPLGWIIIATDVYELLLDIYRLFKPTSIQIFK